MKFKYYATGITVHWNSRQTSGFRCQWIKPADLPNGPLTNSQTSSLAFHGVHDKLHHRQLLIIPCVTDALIEEDRRQVSEDFLIGTLTMPFSSFEYAVERELFPTTSDCFNTTIRHSCINTYGPRDCFSQRVDP